MKKILLMLLITAVAAASFAQEIKFSGEAKTGLYWEQSQAEGKAAETDLKLHSKDDAGGGQGRFRLNMEYNNGNGFGMSARLQWENWSNDDTTKWSYAFAYGNFFEDQLKVSVGKLGGSPWGTGGPEMWKELESSNYGGGSRIEYKPAFIPEEYGKVNVGFVLNWFNNDMDQGTDNAAVNITIAEILKESVIGISYTHDWGMIRLAYRFDSELDANQANKYAGSDAGKGEDEFVYRVEERILTNYVPGLQFWALGHLFGMSAKLKEIQYFRNWAFVQYEPPEMWGMATPFTAQFRFGHLKTGDDASGARSEMLLKPSFYWNFFEKLLSVGLAFTYNQDFGNKLTEGSPFQYYELEPKVQLNFQSSYIAFAYYFRKEYFHEHLKVPGYNPIMQKHWINMRFCIYY